MSDSKTYQTRKIKMIDKLLQENTELKNRMERLKELKGE